MIRGLAALGVCAHHLGNALFVGYGQIQDLQFWHKLLYLVTRLGHQAVIVFFVLSGVFVGGTLLARRAGFDPAHYLIDRLTRLWIVLLPALILTWAVDFATATAAPGALDGVHHTLWNFGPKPGAYSASWTTALGNIAFLQTIEVPYFGTNLPLWSLSNEFWYYLLFPLLVCSAGGFPHIKGMTPRATAVVAAIAILIWIPGKIVPGFIVWLFGAAVGLLLGRSGPQAPRPLLTGVALLAFAVAVVARYQPLRNSPELGNFLVGASFAPLAFLLAAIPFPRTPGRMLERVSRGLAAISYSLYLFHYPFILLLIATVYRGQRLQPAVGIVHFSGWMLLLIAGATAFWWLFERRTDSLRHFLRRRLRG